MADNAQVLRACQALLEHTEKHYNKTDKSSLLTGNETIPLQLQLTLKRLPAKPTVKPHAIPLKHPLLPESEHKLCLFVRRSTKKAWAKAVEEQGISNVKVMPVEKLRGKYKAYEARRELVKRFDTFLADEALYSRVLTDGGKVFMKAKKLPICLKLKKAQIKDQVSYVRNTTRFTVSGESCLIPVGNMGMTADELAENVALAIEGAVKRLRGGLADVRSLLLKTNKSTALPIYSDITHVGKKSASAVDKNATDASDDE